MSTEETATLKKLIHLHLVLMALGATAILAIELYKFIVFTATR